MKVAIVYNQPVSGRPDSEDILDEVNLVTCSLNTLGYDFRLFSIEDRDTDLDFIPLKEGQNIPSGLNESISSIILRLKKYGPDVVFNLVEEVNNSTYQQFFAILFELHKYPMTGSGHEAILTTTDKIRSKRVMKAFGLITPLYQEYRGAWKGMTFLPPWIVKPSQEDASIGIDDNSVFHDESKIANALPIIYERHDREPLLIEQYINGREFNISLLERYDERVEVLPIAEILFNDWPVDKPRIVSYKAKWDRKSFDYYNTVRRFNPPDTPSNVLRDMALKCWDVFNLKGYARIDMRMDRDGNIFIIEVNTNPCISPDAGFIIAAHEAGYETKDVIKNIIEVAIKEG